MGAGIIVLVDEPTELVNQMSVAEKKARSHICIDPRPLNEALKHEHYRLSTLEDVHVELTKAEVFSVWDLKSGYLHCELDHASSLLTPFTAPFRRHQWLCLPFGLRSAVKSSENGYIMPWKVLENSTAFLKMMIIWG